MPKLAGKIAKFVWRPFQQRQVSILTVFNEGENSALHFLRSRPAAPALTEVLFDLRNLLNWQFALKGQQNLIFIGMAVPIERHHKANDGGERHHAAWGRPHPVHSRRRSRAGRIGPLPLWATARGRRQSDLVLLAAAHHFRLLLGFAAAAK